LCPYNNRKLDFRSKKCVFLGYSSLHKGYKCLHVPTNRVYISRDVVFAEGVFPFSQLPTNTTDSTNHSTPHYGQFDDIAHTPLLLPNHGAGKGRGARLELLNSDDDGLGVDHTDAGRDVDRVHASPSAPHAGPEPSLDSLSEWATPSTPSRGPGTAQPSRAESITPIRLEFSPLPAPTSPPARGPPAAPSRPITRLQHGIKQPKTRTDVAVAWNATCMSHAVERASADHVIYGMLLLLLIGNKQWMLNTRR
jgi:hypothetical protein